MTEDEMNARIDQMEKEVKELKLMAAQLRILLDNRKSSIENTMNNGFGRPSGMSDIQWKMWKKFEEAKHKIMY